MEFAFVASRPGIDLAAVPTRGVKPMLRVITVRQGSTNRLELHGMLGGEWVPLLEQHWRAIVDGGASAGVTVVLSNVDFIDPDGEGLLQRMADAGVRFVVSGCMNRYVVDRLQASARATTKGVRA
jgi:hypothetical protein